MSHIKAQCLLLKEPLFIAAIIRNIQTKCHKMQFINAKSIQELCVPKGYESMESLLHVCTRNTQSRLAVGEMANPN